METETLRVASPQESFSRRLYELTPEEQETRAAWLGRAALVAEEFADHRVTERELDYVEKLLPVWYFSPGKIHTKHFGIARRLAPTSPGQLAELPRYKTARSVAAVESGNIVLLASTALYGRDLKSVFEIEQAYEGLAQSPAITPPTLRKKPEGVNGATTIDPPELHQASGLLLTSRERDVLQILPLGISGVSAKLDINASAANKRINHAGERNKMNRAELLSSSVEGGLVDMNLLPPPKPYSLTEIELALLRNHPFDNREAAASAMDIKSIREITRMRKSIFKKFGLPDGFQTLTHAFLVAKRDSVI